MEVGTSVVIAISYLGWTSAQLTALGLVFSTLSGGAISLQTGHRPRRGDRARLHHLGRHVVGGDDRPVPVGDDHRRPGAHRLAGRRHGGRRGQGDRRGVGEAGKFEFWPKGGTKEWLAFAAAWLTLAIGSIPQQDIFQRVTSAKDEKTAIARHAARRRRSISASPSCRSSSPTRPADRPVARQAAVGRGRARDAAASCPPSSSGTRRCGSQVLFFGALLSAILSTASGAIIAPTALCTENIIQPLYPQHERPPVPADAAHRAGVLHARRAAVRAAIRRRPCTRWCRTPTR